MVDTFVVSCEHGGNNIPQPYQGLFATHTALLDSHRGYDAGALLMAQDIAKALDAPLVASEVSRLLIDLNRPAGHPQQYSAISRRLTPAQRATVASEYFQPYVDELQRLIELQQARGRRVVHLSSHSFTPQFNGRRRQADIGLLYDPARRGERELCARWKTALQQRAPALTVRRNYPYRGSAPGLTQQLRLRFCADHYLGVELELNQQIYQQGGKPWVALRQVVVDTLLAACRQ